jgi:hypothetical protein
MPSNSVVWSNRSQLLDPSIPKSKSETDLSLAFSSPVSFLFGPQLELQLPSVLPGLLAAFGDRSPVIRDFRMP